MLGMYAGGRTLGAQDLIDELTDRESQILMLISEGRSNTAISEELVLSGKTVETHIRNLYAKLGLDSGAGCHRRVRAALIQLDAMSVADPPRLVPIAA